MKKVFKVLFANSVALFVGVPLYFIISIFLTNSLREQYIVDSTQGSDNDMDFITNNLLSFIEQNPFVDFSIFDRWKIQPSLRNDGSCLFHYYKSRDCDWKNDTMILFSGRKYFLNKDTTYLITNDSLHDISFSDQQNTIDSIFTIANDFAKYLGFTHIIGINRFQCDKGYEFIFYWDKNKKEKKIFYLYVIDPTIELSSGLQQNMDTTFHKVGNCFYLYDKGYYHPIH